jgi:two-component sensor histidine kinase
MQEAEQPHAAPDAFLDLGGEMAERLRTQDWHRSPIGPLPAWPTPLRTLVRLMLSAKQPMFIAWGEDLRLLYNDAYAEVLVAKHPAALGEPLLEVWGEIREDLAPIVAEVRQGRPVHMDRLRLNMLRRGYPEETFFAFSYTPVQDEAGAFAGLFCACTETTEQVRLQRALAESEARASRLLESITDGFIAIAPDWRITFLNPQGERILGPLRRPGAAFPGAPFWEAFPEIVGTPFEAVYRRAMEGLCGSTEAYFAPLDTWFDLRVYPTADGICGHFLDVGVRKRAERHRELLIQELNHRVKNTLAIVQAIATQTFRAKPSVEEGTAAFQQRLGALGAAHNLLTRENWEKVSLEALAREVTASACDRSERVVLQGPEVALAPKAAITLAMALHELCTNALKHGALSVEAGRVELDWGEAGPGGLWLMWREWDGPPLEPPTRRGFGLRMIEQALAQEFGGQVTLEFRPGGLVCTLRGRLPPLAAG